LNHAKAFYDWAAEWTRHVPQPDFLVVRRLNAIPAGPDVVHVNIEDGDLCCEVILRFPGMTDFNHGTLASLKSEAFEIGGDEDFLELKARYVSELKTLYGQRVGLDHVK
jgi:hypothetical protein